VGTVVFYLATIVSIYLKMTEKSKPKKRGRPKTRTLKIDHPPEYVAKAIFAAGDVKKKGKKKTEK